MISNTKSIELICMKEKRKTKKVIRVQVKERVEPRECKLSSYMLGFQHLKCDVSARDKEAYSAILSLHHPLQRNCVTQTRLYLAIIKIRT